MNAIRSNFVKRLKEKGVVKLISHVKDENIKREVREYIEDVYLLLDTLVENDDMLDSLPLWVRETIQEVVQPIVEEAIVNSLRQVHNCDIPTPFVKEYAYLEYVYRHKNDSWRVTKLFKQLKPCVVAWIQENLD